MRAYKCDRCGKFFEKYKNQGTAEFFNITRTPKIPDNCLDLCPNCNAELQEWVANVKTAIEALEPEPKIGYWIVYPEGIDPHLVCDKCLSRAPYDCKTNYCPNCGIKMEVKK